MRPTLSLLLTLVFLSVGVRSAPRASGTIRGRVQVPTPAAAPVRPAVGELTAPRHSAPDRRRAIVYLDATPALQSVARVPTRERMDQRDEQFSPHVLAITVGSTVEFPNNDATFHNVFSLSRARTFDLGRYPPGRTGAVRFDRPGIVPVFCDIHSHMSAYILVFSHRFFTIADEDGRYEIADVPTGVYSVNVWSEVGRAPNRRVTVMDGEVTETEFEVARDGR